MLYVRVLSPQRELMLTIENVVSGTSGEDSALTYALDLVFDALELGVGEALVFFSPAGVVVRTSEGTKELLGEVPETLDVLEGWARSPFLSGDVRARVDVTLELPNGRVGTLMLRRLQVAPGRRGWLARVSVPESVSVSGVDALFAAMHQGVALIGPDGEVLHVNEAAASWLGLTLGGDVLDLNARPRLRRDEGDELGARDPLVIALREGGETRGAHVCISGEGTRRCAEVSVSRVGVEPVRWLVVVVDVTAQREKDARRDEMISIASHELRNPLTPLKGFLQIALQQRERDEHIDGSLLRKAEHQVQRIGKLVDGLMDLSRAETGRLVQSQQERVSLSGLLEEHVATMGHDRLVLSVPEEAMWVQGAASSLEQVAGNLIDNALKYSQADARVEITLMRRGDRAVLQIRDDGEGMSRDELERVFERFYRAPSGRAKAGGLGLGLYITRRIVEEHGGTIEVSSELGEWTVVEVSLPMTD